MALLGGAAEVVREGRVGEGGAGDSGLALALLAASAAALALSLAAEYLSGRGAGFTWTGKRGASRAM